MVGNYETGADDFTSGDGAKVRDNAAFVLAVLCDKFGWQIDNYVQGRSGLHFHRECAQDHHACPGSKVSKSTMIALTKAQLAQIRGQPRTPAAPQAVPTVASAAPDIMSVEDIQSALNNLGAKPQIPVTGNYDQATKDAVSSFQKAHDCDVDGWVGPQTTEAIKTALAALPAHAMLELTTTEDIQSALNRLGADPELEVNGDYDQATKAAVAMFQKAHDCDVDGWVGPQTAAAIKVALSATLGAPVGANAEANVVAVEDRAAAE
jgi:peptidoglycan hydrolase-like protein with peptidoglycan-binding domain